MPLPRWVTTSHVDSSYSINGHSPNSTSKIKTDPQRSVSLLARQSPSDQLQALLHRPRHKKHRPDPNMNAKRIINGAWPKRPDHYITGLSYKSLTIVEEFIINCHICQSPVIRVLMFYDFVTIWLSEGWFAFPEDVLVVGKHISIGKCWTVC